MESVTEPGTCENGLTTNNLVVVKTEPNMSPANHIAKVKEEAGHGSAIVTESEAGLMSKPATNPVTLDTDKTGSDVMEIIQTKTSKKYTSSLLPVDKTEPISQSEVINVTVFKTVPTEHDLEGKGEYRLCVKESNVIMHDADRILKRKPGVVGSDYVPKEMLSSDERDSDIEHLRLVAPNPKDHTHRQTGMASQQHECEICGKVFKWKSHLTSHKVLHTGEKRFKCEICGNIFAWKGQLTSHTKMIHTGETRHKCEICGKGFAHKSKLISHQVVHTGEKKYKCEICGKLFPKKRNLTRHQALHTEDKRFKCEICGKAFSRQGNLTLHQVVHTGNRPYECDICGKQFGWISSLYNHKLLHTGEKPYKCDTCGKSFAWKNSLASHCRMVHPDKQYKCETCEKVFVKEFDLTAHQVLHTGDKRYKCENCGKMFAWKRDLTRHQVVHTKDKSYSHEHQQAREAAVLYKHPPIVIMPDADRIQQREHEGSDFVPKKISSDKSDSELLSCGPEDENRYTPKLSNQHHKCEICGKLLSKKSHLTRHQAVHTGEKTFKCKTCGKLFARKADMVSHQVVHTRDYRYKCETCGKGFAKHTDLTKHQDEQKSVNYQCALCQKMFISKCYLIKHQQRWHKGKSTNFIKIQKAAHLN